MNAENKKTKIGIVYPDSIKCGFFSVSLKLLYSTFINLSNTFVDFFFTDIKYFQRSLLHSLKASDFEILAFSIPDESLYLNVLKFLTINGIPLYSINRLYLKPLIFCGGVPIIANPFPIAPFMDFCVIGEIESTLPHIINLYKEVKTKEEFYCRIIKMDWIVSFPYKMKARRAFTENIMLPVSYFSFDKDKSPYPDILIVEVARGCKYKCPYCQLTRIFSPYREVELSALINYIETFRKKDDCINKIYLIAPDAGQYSRIDDLIDFLGKQKLSVITTSLRADKITPSFAKILSGTVRLGIESGETMRRKLGKNFSDTDLIYICRNLLENPDINKIELYFLVGLHENEEEGIINTVYKLIKNRVPPNKLKINISLFIPECHTPFEDVPMLELSKAKKKIHCLYSNLLKLGVPVKMIKSVDGFYLTAIFSKGDERLSKVLEVAYNYDLNWDELTKWYRIAESVGVDMWETMEKRRWKCIKL